MYIFVDDTCDGRSNSILDCISVAFIILLVRRRPHTKAEYAVVRDAQNYAEHSKTLLPRLQYKSIDPLMSLFSL